MIPESDQIFTEVELSTLEKAINETTVTKAQLILGELEVAAGVVFPVTYLHSGLWNRGCVFRFHGTSEPSVCVRVSQCPA